MLLSLLELLATQLIYSRSPKPHSKSFCFLIFLLVTSRLIIILSNKTDSFISYIFFHQVSVIVANFLRKHTQHHILFSSAMSSFLSSRRLCERLECIILVLSFVFFCRAS